LMAPGNKKGPPTGQLTAQ